MEGISREEEKETNRSIEAHFELGRAKASDYIGSLDIIQFATIILDLEPFDYQVDFLLDEEKRIIICSGRQIGKSTMTSVKALFNALKNSNYSILILAPTWKQSQIIYDNIRSMIMRSPILMSFIDRMTMTMTFFKNGSRILCLTAGHSGETSRGFTANMVIFDEAAYISEKVYTSIEPSLATTGGTILLLSTPAGKIGRFYEAWMSPRWSKHKVTSYECPLISPEWINERKAAEGLTDIEFKQEYLAEFVDEKDQWYPLALVKGSIGASEETERMEGFDYYLGVDVARFGTDETCYTIVKVNDQNQIWQIAHYEDVQKPTTHVSGRVIELDKKWNFNKIYVDESGLGGGVVDTLRGSLSGKVEGIQFGAMSEKGDIYKTALHRNLKVLMETKQLFILADSKLVNQTQQIGYQFSGNGRLNIIKSERGHDDLVDSLGLACMFMVKKSSVVYLEKMSDFFNEPRRGGSLW